MTMYGPRPPGDDWRLGIRGKLMLVVVLSIGLVLIAFLFNVRGQYREDRERAKQESLSIARQVAGEIDRHINEVDLHLQLYGSRRGFEAEDIPGNIAYLGMYLAKLPNHYNQLKLHAPDGSSRGSSLGSLNHAGIRDYFQNALSSRGMAIGTPVVSRTNQEWNFSVARAILNDDGSVRGVASASTRLMAFQDILDNNGLPKDMLVTVISRDGVVIARTREPEKWVGQNIIALGKTREIITRGEGVEAMTSLDGTLQMAAFTRSKITGWTIYAGIPESIALAAAQRQLWLGLSLVGAAALIALALAWRIASHITAPIRQITQDAQALGAGDLTQRTAVTTHDEVGSLAATFNYMADAIQRHEAALRASEARTATIINTATDAILTVDGKQRITVFNHAAEKMFGYAAHEAIGRPIDDLLPDRGREHHPDEGDRGEGIIADLSFSSMARRAACRADGSEFPIEASIAEAVTPDGPLYTIIIRDITDRTRTERRQRVMMQELDHRVKNNLASVLSLARESIVHAKNSKDFEKSFIGRLEAMSRAHMVLARSRWEGVDFAELTRMTLEPYIRGEHPRVVLEGPSVMLPAKAAGPLSMSLHELATNAVKYGSLSSDTGRVHLAWSLDEQDQFSIAWSERGGPPVSEPTHRGLGVELIEGLIRHELQGEVVFEFRESGIVCRINVPFRPNGAQAEIAEWDRTHPTPSVITAP